MIDSGFRTRIYYVALDGFDTHSQQASVHARLLEQMSGEVTAFVNDLAHHGHLDRTAVLMFSEFGRRVAENASGGTDHGGGAGLWRAAASDPGLIGAHPSLTDLDDGDLKHHTDFRQVYAALLDEWIRWPSEQILGERFDPVKIFAHKRLAAGADCSVNSATDWRRVEFVLVQREMEVCRLGVSG